MLLITITLALIGLSGARAISCPKIDLDWQSYDGTIDDQDVCVYQNVRFASPPTGKLRFAKPAYPPSKDDPPSPDGPIACVRPTNLVRSPVPPGGGPAPAEGCDKKKCMPSMQDKIDEDCLFLDVYVPMSAFEADSSELPVIVWFFGGGFITGSKHPYDADPIDFYSGSSIVKSVSEPAIFVAGNYRIGAYGWLAGSYMEANAQPNAGLHDQRAVLRFVHDHITKFKGDSSRVSVWGESAGASSILHHMVMPENVETPLFNTAVMQSPAYQWLWDREGTLNQSFTRFAEAVAQGADCEIADIECLRNADAAVLANANNKLLSSLAITGIIPVGPSVDGETITDLSHNLLAGNKCMKLSSVIVSHVEVEVPVTHEIEGASFIPAPIRQDPMNETKFDDFIGLFFPGDEFSSIRDGIRTQYPSSDFDGDQAARAASIITDSSFVCNTRDVVNAYASKIPTYAMDYSFFGRYGIASHGTDLLPLFSAPGNDYVTMFDCLSCGKLPGFVSTWISNTVSNRLGPGLRSYFMSLALHDDPNKLATGEAKEKKWSPATTGDCEGSGGKRKCVQNVMKPTFQTLPTNTFRYNSQEDPQTDDQRCGFWGDVAAKIKKMGKHHKPILRLQDPKGDFFPNEL